MTDIVQTLRQLADAVEAQQAPHNYVLHLRAGADEIERLRFEISDKHNSVVFLRSEITKLTEAFGIQNAEVTRLRAGGCARDQGTTQYCAEAAKLAADNERLRAALLDIADGMGETDLAEVGRYAKYIARAALETREAGVSAKPLEEK